MNSTLGPARSIRFYLSLGIGTVILIFIWYVALRNLTLAQIQDIGRAAKHHADNNPLLVFAALALTQAVGMVFSLPTKALLTLLAGALLGTLLGTICTISGVITGTTILFFVSRHLLREKILRHLVGKVGRIEKRISHAPIRTMVGLRLFVALPYGPCTITAALSSMRYRDFLIGTAIGDFPVVLLYCIAGERLFALTSSNEALSPATIGILISVGCIILAGTLFSRKRSTFGNSDTPSSP